MQLPSLMGRGATARTHARKLFSRLPWMRSMRLFPALPERLYSQQAAPIPPPDRLSAAQLLYSVAGAPQHQLPGHVERPQRVAEVLAALKASGVAGSSKLMELTGVQPAQLDDVRQVHSYVDELLAAAREDAPTAVADIGDPDGVTYVTHSSFDDALQAAGVATALVDAVTAANTGSSSSSSSSSSSGSTSGFGITRPPGHHATADTPLGYCLFNNVALAARHAQKHLGLKKVLILDYDLHHGNGTCEIFYDDPSVLFIDTHERSSIYPPPFCGGDATDIGEGSGRGATINIPLPRFAGDVCALTVFDEVIAPAALRFAPDLILVSAGYDAHWRDPFQQLQFRSSTYHSMATRLKALAAQLCGGRLVFMLEGGYQVDAVGEAVSETFLGLLGEPSVEGKRPLQLPHEEPLPEVRRLVRELRSIHGLS